MDGHDVGEEVRALVLLVALCGCAEVLPQYADCRDVTLRAGQQCEIQAFAGPWGKP